jgi:hypothetical protein
MEGPIAFGPSAAVAVFGPQPQELAVEATEQQSVRLPQLVGTGRVASPDFVEARRGDRFSGKVVSSSRPILTIRSEIGPYRRPTTALSSVTKNNHRRHSGLRSGSVPGCEGIKCFNPESRS